MLTPRNEHRGEQGPPRVDSLLAACNSRCVSFHSDQEGFRSERRRREWKTITAPRGWPSLEIRELFEYRDLALFLVLRDIKVLYKQTILGFGWAIIRPLFSMLVFTIVFGKIAQVSSDGVPYAVFSYVALVPWTYFSSSVSASATSLIAQVDVLTKVYFPRLIFPAAPVLSNLVDFVIALSLTGFFLLWYGIAPTSNIVFLPLLVAMMMLTAAGFGMWLSALAIQYRDVKYATHFMTQLMMFAAPVVWPVSALTDRFGETVRLLYGLYPMAGVIEGFRSMLLGTHPMPWDLIITGFLAAVLIFVTGALYFKRMERRFADVA